MVTDFTYNGNCIASKQGIVCGKGIEYRLTKEANTAPVYKISIRLGDECILRELSEDFSYSLYIFKYVSKNLVTPCTLDDVLEDNFGIIFIKN
ncbi:MAG: hypothetical protein U0M06_14630 [Clostridia bacterium]|nr:hypothetical protein [Clostridia bacterium]